MFVIRYEAKGIKLYLESQDPRFVGLLLKFGTAESGHSYCHRNRLYDKLDNVVVVMEEE